MRKKELREVWISVSIQTNYKARKRLNESAAMERINQTKLNERIDFRLIKFAAGINLEYYNSTTDTTRE